MKLYLALLGFFAAICFQYSAADAQSIEKTTLRSENKDRVCSTFVPEKLEATSPVPLVVLLHGAGRGGLSEAEKWKDLAKKEQFIIAAPDSLNPAGWQIPGDGPDFIRDVVEYMASKYPVDKRRVYLFGHSAGAIMALNMSLFESQYFAATATRAGVLQKTMYPVIAEAKRKIPIVFIVGKLDTPVMIDPVRTSRSELAKGGFKVEWAEIDGITQDYYAVAKDVNARAWTFLKAQRLESDPVYAKYDFK